MHGVGMDYPVYADLKKYVYDAGKASGAGDQEGSVIYSRGMYAAMVIAEAIRKAQEIHGTAAVNAKQVRDGFEQLEVTEARMAELGLPNFGQPFAATPDPAILLPLSPHVRRRDVMEQMARHPIAQCDRLLAWLEACRTRPSIAATRWESEP